MYIESNSIVKIYVEDFLIFSNDRNEIYIFQEVCRSRFKVKDLSQVKNVWELMLISINKKSPVLVSGMLC